MANKSQGKNGKNLATKSLRHKELTRIFLATEDRRKMSFDKTARRENNSGGNILTTDYADYADLLTIKNGGEKVNPGEVVNTSRGRSHGVNRAGEKNKDV